MPGVVRQGDKNSSGGAAEVGVSSVLVNNKPIAVNGTNVSSHSRHNRKKTANGVSTVVAGNRPVNVIGNKDTCGHARVGGSPNVIAR